MTYICIPFRADGGVKVTKWKKKGRQGRSGKRWSMALNRWRKIKLQNRRTRGRQKIGGNDNCGASWKMENPCHSLGVEREIQDPGTHSHGSRQDEHNIIVFHKKGRTWKWNMCWQQTVCQPGRKAVGTKKNEGGMTQMWKYTLATQVIWKASRGQESSVGPQLEDLGMETLVSPETRTMNLKETSLDEEENHDHVDEREGMERSTCLVRKIILWPEPAKVVLTNKANE